MKLFIQLSLGKIQKIWIIEEILSEVKVVRLQEKVGKQNYYIDSLKKFKPPTKTIKHPNEKQLNLHNRKKNAASDWVIILILTLHGIDS